jgi:hypothetical protein
MTTFADNPGLCACQPRCDVHSRIDHEHLDCTATPFRLQATISGFYDVVATTGHRANSLSLCVHEAQRLCDLLNK